MANIIFDSRLRNNSYDYADDYKDYLYENNWTKQEYPFLDYMAECVKDEEKSIRLAFKNRTCPNILVIYKNNGKTSYTILRSNLLCEIMDTIKLNSVLTIGMADLVATIYGSNGNNTEILYRFIKDGMEDSFDFKRVISKIEKGEEYSKNDLSRSTSSIRPLMMEIFEPKKQQSDADLLGVGGVFGFVEEFD